MHKKINSKNRLPRSWTALHKNSTLLSIFQTLKHGTNTHIVTYSLLIQEIKKWSAPDHRSERILKRFGRLYPTMVYKIQEVAIRRLFSNKPLYEVTEFLHLIHNEEWRRRIPVLIDIR